MHILHVALVLQALLSAGAKQGVNRTGLSPLRFAAMHGHAAVVLALLEAGADVDCASPLTGWTALREAVHGRYGRLYM